MSPPKALIVPALRAHTASIIVAHGLGDSGAGWIFLAENWRRREKFENVSFIFPNAPTIPITINMGMRMPGWYDITTFNHLSTAFDEEGVLRSREYLNTLIRDEIAKGIPSNRIILGGFSQGGAMSIFTGITSPDRLGGIFGLSSYMLMPTKLRDFVPPNSPNKDTPIFMGHGDRDPLVRHAWGVETARMLKEWGWNVTLKTYAGIEHTVNDQEIDDLEHFVQERLSATATTHESSHNNPESPSTTQTPSSQKSGL